MSKWLIGVAALVIVFGAIFGGKYYVDHRAAGNGQGYPAASVATAEVKNASWDVQVRAIGTLRAISGTEITAQIAGNVTKIAFKSGTRVKKGDLLVKLDDSNQLAALHSDRAQLKLADANLKRTKQLVKSHAVSREQLETAQRNHDKAAAAVENDKATLSKLHITAPFDGVLGIREVSLGQYVSPGTSIVNLQRWQPIFLDFSLPQEKLSRLDVGQAVHFETDAWPDQAFAGKITAIGSQVNPDTRNVNLQATLDNTGDKLRPGLFGHVMLELGKSLKGVVVPQTSVTASTFGDTVYVVSKGEHGGRVAHAKVVHVLSRREGKVLLRTDGLKSGDTVVTAGQNKLRDGAPVTINNSIQP